MGTAPIAIFGYDRPEHLQNMVESLLKNKESKNSDVYFFVDGATNKTDIQKHEQVIQIANENFPFKSQKTILREKNISCKFNIITGISEVLESRDSVIVLEDDLVLGKYFLNYMNSSLEKYKEYDEIWHVNGYAHPQLFKNKKKASLSVLCQPWGWGTWNDKWDEFIKNKYYEKNIISTLEDSERRKYNFYDLATYWESALKLDQVNKNSIWDAYWYQTVFLNNGLTVFPQQSHIQNSGFDGSGIHCGVNNDFDTEINDTKTIKFPKQIKESKLYRFNTYLFYKKYTTRRYFRYHQHKISSFKNFKSFLTDKTKSIFNLN
jgi:hypothetical protein